MSKWLIGAAAVLMVSICGAYIVLCRLGVSSPPYPSLSAEPQSSSVEIDGVVRTFTYYAPRGMKAHPGLLLVYHGGDGSPEQMRNYAAFEFDEIAEKHGLVVVYPQGYEGYWNTCQKGRTTAATKLNIDDVGFARKLIDWFSAKYDIDRSSVFAAGFSNGGHMCYRLALEMPGEIAAFAAVSANQPTAADSKCRQATRPVSLMIINGTEDPFNPYDGGELSFYGIRRMGPVMSTLDTASSFLPPQGQRVESSARYPESDGDPDTWVERKSWSVGSSWEVAAVTVHGGGHSVPQQKYRFPRLFGRTSAEFDAPVEIWRFFQRRDRARRDSMSDDMRDVPKRESQGSGEYAE